MSNGLHWGDLPIIHDTESGIAAIEREQMTKPRPLNVEGPLLYQPSGDYMSSGSSLYETKEEFTLDPTTQQTIQLLQYCNQLSAQIEDAHHQLEQTKSGECGSLNFVPSPPLPAWQPPKKEHPTMRPFAYIPEDQDSLFVRGMSKKPSQTTLDETTCKLLLRRSVAAICAHAGFQTCSQSVLDTLTDVSHEYFCQMLRLLRAAVDGETYHGSTGFPDAISRVFYEMGIGNLSTIYEFYQNRIVLYHKRLLQKCINLRDVYEQLRKPRTSVISDKQTASRSKDDSLSVIHFPSTDEVEETGEMEQLDQLEGLGLDMTVSQESSTTMEEESSGKWKSESGNSKHEQTGFEDRMSLGDSGLPGPQSDNFHPPLQFQSDSKRSTVSGNVISTPSASFVLKPPLKKFKK